MITVGEQIRILLDESVLSGKISERKLICGLCTREMLHKIINDGAFADLKMVRILIQRLGKSPNKLEFVVSKKIIDSEHEQLYFDESIDTGDRKTALKMLDKFEAEALCTDSLRADKMYFLRNKAKYEYYFNKNYVLPFDYMEEAVEITIPGWNVDNLNDYAISTIEIENLLAYCMLKYCKIPGGSDDKYTDRENPDESIRCGRKLISSITEYVERNILDEEEKASVMPKCKWVSALLYIREKDYVAAVHESEEGIEYLRDFALLHFMPPLLGIIQEYGENIDLKESYANYKEYNDVLYNLFKEYGTAEYKFDSLFTRCNRIVYHYDAEIYAAQRRIRDLTQEQLAEAADVSPDMISKFEHGKRSPNKTNYPKLMKALGLEWDRYSTALICEDFKILEIIQDIGIHMEKEEFEEAEKKLQAIKSKIDDQYRRNRRVIRNKQLYIDLGFKRISPEEGISQAKEFLKETYPFFDMEINRPPLSDEVNLLNQIGVCYDYMGRRKDIAWMYKKLVNIIDDSYVDNRLKVRIYGLLLGNCAQMSDDSEYFQKALRYRITGRDLSGIESLISSFAVFFYKLDKTGSKRLMTNALIAARLLKKNKNYQRIKEFVDKYFNQ